MVPLNRDIFIIRVTMLNTSQQVTMLNTSQQEVSPLIDIMNDPNKFINELGDDEFVGPNFKFLLKPHFRSNLTRITKLTGKTIEFPESIKNYNDVHKVLVGLDSLMKLVGAEEIISFGNDSTISLSQSYSDSSSSSSTASSPQLSPIKRNVLNSQQKEKKKNIRKKVTKFQMIGNNSCSDVFVSLTHWKNCKICDYNRALSFVSEFAFCVNVWIREWFQNKTETIIDAEKEIIIFEQLSDIIEQSNETIKPNETIKSELIVDQQTSTIPNSIDSIIESSKVGPRINDKTNELAKQSELTSTQLWILWIFTIPFTPLRWIYNMIIYLCSKRGDSDEDSTHYLGK